MSVSACFFSFATLHYKRCFLYGCNFCNTLRTYLKRREKFWVENSADRAYLHQCALQHLLWPDEGNDFNHYRVIGSLMANCIKDEGNPWNVFAFTPPSHSHHNTSVPQTNFSPSPDRHLLSREAEWAHPALSFEKWPDLVSCCSYQLS